MNPKAAIGMLDRAIKRGGSFITIGDGEARTENMPAKVSTLDSDKMQGEVSQTDVQVILSPTGLALAPWGGAMPKTTTPVFLAGRLYVVQGKPRPFYIGTTLVRVEMVVRG